MILNQSPYFTDDVFEFLAYETNCYGGRCKEKSEKHLSKWDPVSVNEMKTYIVLCILQWALQNYHDCMTIGNKNIHFCGTFF